MTLITLHHLCFGHCVNLSVIVLDRGIFLRKIPRSKTITSDLNDFLTMTLKKMVCSYYCLIEALLQDVNVDHFLY